MALTRQEEFICHEAAIALAKNNKDYHEWKEGSYTLALYLDQNKNNRLDKGLFGQPLEPYAFSNNARASFSEPPINDQKFLHPQGVLVIQVK